MFISVFSVITIDMDIEPVIVFSICKDIVQHQGYL